MFTRFVISSVALAMAACVGLASNAEPSSQNSNEDMLNVSALEFAVRVPEQYRLREEGASFTLTAKNGRTGEVREEDLLMLSADVAESPFLSDRRKAGHKIGRYRVDPADIARLDAFSAALMAWKADSDSNSAGEHSLSFSANALGCLERIGASDEGLIMEIYMRTDPEKDFYTLVDEQPLDVSSLPDGVPDGIMALCDS
ncbi:MAG: hypothetical protein AAF950_09925 [Pseudomonadota bacterium]